MSVLGWLLSHKILCLLIVAVTAFAISTIVLGVENGNLHDEIDDLRLQIGLTTESPVTTDPSVITTETPEEDMTNYKLPTNVVPTKYDLYLYPDMESGLFRGSVTITVTVQEDTPSIKVHANGLTIDSVTINEMVCTAEIDTLHELLIITREDGDVFTAGDAELLIGYSGDMRNRIVGLYLSSYQNEEGIDRYMATSKFEPTYARQAYPCFDEPNMKANFTVHLLKPNDSNYIALSNMPQESETVEDNGIMVHFRESVKMPTYLTCFIICDFGYTNDTIGEDIEFRVFATPAQVGKTEYAREIGKAVIEYFIEYFDIKFPLPKLDMAAIPDFVSGAMEHWGLVTFRETALLYSSESSSSANKQRIATVVSHELAHSWFGNLVTMNWWNDLWLNEGFASYIQFKGVDHAEPDWQMEDQFLIEELHAVLILDATLGSHPIVQTVTTPDEITEVFDTISYNKGASILRMLERAIGEENFRNGVTKYLNAHLYGNAVTQDLWDALEESVEENTNVINVTKFMNTWTLQMGYPVVDVVTEGNTYVLTQKRYLTNQEAVDDTATPYNYKWTIPITYITSNVLTPQYVWFDYTEEKVVIEKPEGIDWIKFNVDQVGYYRVNYETSGWENLTANVIDLTESDKAHLIEETFRMAQSGHIPYDIPLNFVRSVLKTETQYIPWAIASTVLQELYSYLSSSQVLSEFKTFVIDLITTAYNDLTWEEATTDNHLRRRARVTVLDLACKVGHEDCLSRASTMFESWLSNDEVVLSQDLRSLVYSYGMAASPASHWETLFDIFSNETDASEKLKLMHGLTQVTDTALLIRLIDIAKVDGVIRSQDYFTLLQYIAGNPIGTPIVWDYVRENWLALVERFTINERYLGRLIPAITKTFSTNVKLEELRAFFEKYPEAGAGAAARVQAEETIINNIQWLANYKETIETWISNNTR